MVYIRDAELHEQRPWLRPSIITDLFWGIVNFFPGKYTTGAAETDYRRQGGNGRRPGDDDSGFPRRRIGGLRHNNGPSAPPMGGG
eukprot:gene8343-882_t